MTIKVAITGTGWAARVHAIAIQASKIAQMTAVVNHREETRKSFAAEFAIPKNYQDVTDLLTHEKIDALIVCTPNYLHLPQTITALEAGVHVMVEKPMAMNSVEAQQMVNVAQTSGSYLMLAHCFRFDPDIIWLRKQIEQGVLGNPVRTKSYGVHVAWGPAGWFVDKKFAGGGALVDMGIHAIDTTRFLLGDPQPESVYAQIGTYYKDLDVDDTGIIIINWHGGTTSYVESGWWQPHSDGICAATQIYGTLGFGQTFPTEVILSNENSAKEKRSPEYKLKRDSQPPQVVYNDQMAYFLECILEGIKPSPDGVDGLVSIQLLDAAYQSAASGIVVRL